MNLRPSGYEPDELPGCSTPRRGPAHALGGRGKWVLGMASVVVRRRYENVLAGLPWCGLFLRLADLATTYSPAS